MSDNATRPTDADISDFIGLVENKHRQADATALLPLFNTWTNMEPVLWANGLAGKPGNGIIGYGHYHYRYKSGREGDWFLTGFSPRKQNMAVYIMPGFKPFQKHLERLGPHKHSVSCLYLTNLEKVDLGIHGEIVTESLEIMKERYDWRSS